MARLEVRALVATRVAALLNVAVALGTGIEGGRVPAAAAALAGALLVESSVLSLAALRTVRLPAWAGAADTAVGCAALAVNALLVSGPDVHTWGFFAYPYTLVASCACGLLLHGGRRVGAASVCLAAVYVVSDHAASGQPWWNAVPNAGSYLGIGPVTWLVARELRRLGGELDASRATALGLAREAGVAGERTKQARLLHDRVLQTLETLAHGRWVADAWMRDQVRAEAGWLRWLIDHGPDAATPHGVPMGTDLGTALHALAQERVRQGLRVAVHLPAGRGAHFADVPGEAADAVLAACHEALTNVRKHAGTDRAAVAAAVEDGHLVVSVTDQGRGFDPSERPERTGLARSVRGRLADIGGSVSVSSAWGEGTVVELRVPLPSQALSDGSRAEPKADGCGGDGAVADAGPLVVQGGDGPEGREPVDGALDLVAPPVGVLVEGEGRPPLLPWRRRWARRFPGSGIVCSSWRLHRQRRLRREL